MTIERALHSYPVEVRQRKVSAGLEMKGLHSPFADPPCTCALTGTCAFTCTCMLRKFTILSQIHMHVYLTPSHTCLHVYAHTHAWPRPPPRASGAQGSPSTSSTNAWWLTPSGVPQSFIPYVQWFKVILGNNCLKQLEYPPPQPFFGFTVTRTQICVILRMHNQSVVLQNGQIM